MCAFQSSQKGYGSLRRSSSQTALSPHSGPPDPVGQARRVDADLARDLRAGGSPLVARLRGAPLELRRVLRARFSHGPPPSPRNGNGAETGLDLSTDSGQIQIHVEGSDLTLEEPVEDGQLFAFTTCSYQTRNSRTTVFAVWGYNAHWCPCMGQDPAKQAVK